MNIWYIDGTFLLLCPAKCNALNHITHSWRRRVGNWHIWWSSNLYHYIKTILWKSCAWRPRGGGGLPHLAEIFAYGIFYTYPLTQTRYEENYLKKDRVGHDCKQILKKTWNAWWNYTGDFSTQSFRVVLIFWGWDVGSAIFLLLECMVPVFQVLKNRGKYWKTHWKESRNIILEDSRYRIYVIPPCSRTRARLN